MKINPEPQQPASPDSLDDRLRSRVSRARAEAGLSQAEIEQALHLPSGAFSKIENGSRSLSSAELVGLARLTGHDIGWFFEENAARVPLLRGEAASLAGRADLSWLQEFARAYCFLESELNRPRSGRLDSRRASARPRKRT